MLDVTTTSERPEGEAPEAEDLGAERGPVRTCVGCRVRAPKDDLVRLGIVPAELRAGGAAVIVDVARKVPGRGVHVHPSPVCVRAAVERGGIARAVRGAPGLRAEELLAALVARLDERVDGLLGGARRARKLAVGTDATTEAIDRGAVHALLVAGDAAGRSGELAERVRGRDGAVISFRDKKRLGALVRGSGRASASEDAAELFEVGVVAILDPGIAAEVVRTLGRVAQLAEAR